MYSTNEYLIIIIITSFFPSAVSDSFMIVWEMSVLLICTNLNLLTLPPLMGRPHSHTH